MDTQDKSNKEAIRSISSFFSAASTNDPSISSTGKPIATTSPPEAYDFVEDGPLTDSIDGISTLIGPQSFHNLTRHGTATGRRFILPTDSKSHRVPQQHSSSVDQTAWYERYAPTSLAEIAVNKKKVNEVRAWLEKALDQDAQERLLVLKGPSGAGKSTTMELLGKDMNVEVAEWRNPTTALPSEPYTSISAQFQDFLGRGRNYHSLDIGSDASTEPNSDHSLQASASVLTERRRVIVVEDLPNSLIYSASALQTFRACISEYISDYKSSGTKEASIPLVIIISESSMHSTGVSDELTAYGLLGPNILHHTGTRVIEFNPVAGSFLAKAMDRILAKEGRINGRVGSKKSELVKKLGDVGDIRSAINSLEFLCIEYTQTSATLDRQSGKAQNDNAVRKFTSGTSEAGNVSTNRECSLGLFHAVGKVIYNKLDEPERSHPVESHLFNPTSHTQESYNFQLSDTCAISKLMTELCVDTTTFVATIHENYVPSCNGSSMVDRLIGCLDAMSESDLLSHRHGSDGSLHAMRTSRSSSQTELSRNEEISFHVAVRGVLQALPCPVNRTHQTHATQADKTRHPSRIYFPSSLRLPRNAREIQDLALQLLESNVARRIDPEEVGTRSEEKHLPNRNFTHSIKDMILVYLPYFAIIRREADATQLKVVRKITEIGGYAKTHSDSQTQESMEIDTPLANLARLRSPSAVDSGDPASRTSWETSHDGGGATGVEDTGKLYLVEDEIEDDL